MTELNQQLVEAVAIALRDSPWFCERGDFWGTVKQLILCARCGGNDHKRQDEPRHYADIFTPRLHVLCDACFDSLPEDAAQPPTETNDGNRC